MVRKIEKSKKLYFECEECKFVYKARSLAKKCEDYCKKHHSCNLEITKYAIAL